MDTDPTDALDHVRDTVHSLRTGTAAGGGSSEEFLVALTALRLLRDELAGWEPELITAARDAGASWAALAPALGVASRQAAERRYLRLQPSATGETTGEARVDAERDRRAGDRAVAAWARDNAAVLRTLAARLTARDALDTATRAPLDHALGQDDAADLVDPITATGPHLGGRRTALGREVAGVLDHTTRLRRDATAARRQSSDG